MSPGNPWSSGCWTRWATRKCEERHRDRAFAQKRRDLQKAAALPFQPGTHACQHRYRREQGAGIGQEDGNTYWSFPRIFPALKPEMVDWLVDTCMETKDDLYYGDLHARSNGESVSPNRNGPIPASRGRTLRRGHQHHARPHGDRTSRYVGVTDRHTQESLRQAGIIGLGTLFQVLTRSITLEDLVEKVCKRIGIKGRAIMWSMPKPAWMWTNLINSN
jgi:hypothetical protein